MVVVILSVAAFSLFLRPKDAKYAENKMCYTHRVKKYGNYSNNVVFFENLLTSFKQPIASRGIFFVNVNCSLSGIFEISPR